MTTPTTLPPAAADPVLVMLEALIHLEAFDAFGWLVAVLEAVAMPWRDRRERLALLYLRRGFLDLAADEWITVCERRRPDAAVLAGLVQIAAARGLYEDAETFAREALLLPARPPGRRRRARRHRRVARESNRWPPPASAGQVRPPHTDQRVMGPETKPRDGHGGQPR